MWSPANLAMYGLNIKFATLVPNDISKHEDTAEVKYYNDISESVHHRRDFEMHSRNWFLAWVTAHCTKQSQWILS